MVSKFFLTLLTVISPNFCAGSGVSRDLVPIHSVFSPQSKAELQSAVATCSELHYDKDKAPNENVSPHGPIGLWDVSDVTDMSRLFGKAEKSHFGTTQLTTENSFHPAVHFDDDISKWDVSSVTNMDGMFFGAMRFKGDISKWDVSSVVNMGDMFRGAARFNICLSKWDVSSATDMKGMF